MKGQFRRIAIFALPVSILISACGSNPEATTQMADSKYHEQLNAVYEFRKEMTNNYYDEYKRRGIRDASEFLEPDFYNSIDEMGEQAAPDSLNRVVPNFLLSEDLMWLNSYEFLVEGELICVIPNASDKYVFVPLNFELVYGDCGSQKTKNLMESSLEKTISDIANSVGGQSTGLEVFLSSLTIKNDQITNLELEQVSARKIKATYLLGNEPVTEVVLINPLAKLSFSYFQSRFEPPFETFCYVIQRGDFQFRYTDKMYTVHSSTENNLCEGFIND